MSSEVRESIHSDKKIITNGKEHVSFEDAESFQDKSLWTNFKDDNQLAFQQLYQKYYSILFNYAIRLSNDEDITRDCIQDLFVDLWKYKDTMATPDSVKNYLLMSIRRKIIRATTRNKKFLFGNKKVEKYTFDFVPSIEQSTVDKEYSSERNDRLIKAMNQLSPKQKEAIYLKYYQNMSSPEIAKVMSLTINSTYVIISESMKVLKKCIRDYLPLAFLFLYEFSLISSLRNIF